MFAVGRWDFIPMLSFFMWTCIIIRFGPACPPPTPPFSPWLGRPGFLPVPRTSQQGSWAGLLRRLCLQAPCVGGFLWLSVTSPVRPSRAMPGNSQPPFSLTPWLIILFSIALSTICSHLIRSFMYRFSIWSQKNMFAESRGFASLADSCITRIFKSTQQFQGPNKYLWMKLSNEFS